MGTLKPNIQLHQDFEVLPKAYLQQFTDYFNKVGEIPVKHFVLHPETKQPTIIDTPKTIILDLKGEMLKKIADSSWKVGSTVSQVLSNHNINSPFTLLQNENDIALEAKIENIDTNHPVVIVLQDSIIEPPKPICKTLPSVYSAYSKSKLPPLAPSFSPLVSSSDISFPKPVGLRNLGNTCFFNAAVQCLARCQDLTQFMLSNQFDKQLNIHNPSGTKGEIARAYRDFLRDICGPSSSARDPSNLRRAIISKYRRFANYGQQDSQELLCSLLDGLHEDFNQSSFAKGNNPAGKITSEMDSWQVHCIKHQSPIVDLFHGTLFSSIECPNCGNIESVEEPFEFLSVSIPTRFNSKVTLEECLKSFSQCDTLDSNNKWKCEKCKQKVCAIKRTGIKKCGKYLIIHLKRFSGSGYSSRKIDIPVNYPDKLTSFCEDQSSCRLIGAVFHSGGLGGGHYTAAAYDECLKEWFNFNDSQATQISASSAHSGSAYILIYKKE